MDADNVQRRPDRVRPESMATASSMPLAFGMPWSQLVMAWKAGLALEQVAPQVTAVQRREDADGTEERFRG